MPDDSNTQLRIAGSPQGSREKFVICKQKMLRPVVDSLKIMLWGYFCFII